MLLRQRAGRSVAEGVYIAKEPTIIIKENVLQCYFSKLVVEYFTITCFTLRSVGWLVDWLVGVLHTSTVVGH